MQLGSLQTTTALATTEVVRVEPVGGSVDGTAPDASRSSDPASVPSATFDVAGSAKARAAVTSSASSAATEPRTADAAMDPTTQAPGNRGLRARQPRLQLQMSSAQQARDFLELTAAQLQSLKATLSARLAGLRSQDAQLQSQLSDVTSTWRSRQAATGGSVDAQLRFSGSTTASQRFSVRGLDLRTLRAGGAETLSVSFAGVTALSTLVGAASGGSTGGTAGASIDIDPRLSDEALVKRFDQALSPLGLGVDADASGALIFSVAEAAWPAVRDSLAVRGNGIRFPAGQPTRARTDAEPAALQPQEWTMQDAAGLRHALAEVTQALDRVRQARASVERALAEAARQVDAAQTSDGSAAQALAAGFVSTTSQPGYQALSAVSTALAGTSRSRVASLLALPDAG